MNAFFVKDGRQDRRNAFFLVNKQHNICECMPKFLKSSGKTIYKIAAVNKE